MSLPDLTAPPSGAGPFSNMDFMRDAPIAPLPFNFMQSSQAPPVVANPQSAALDTKGHYMLFGDHANRKVFYQARRLFLGNGRLLQQEELADEDKCGFVPKELRRAVAEDMLRPPPPPPMPMKSLFNEQVQLSPEERLKAMDLFVSGPPVHFRDHQAKGIIYREQITR
jgi:hypothetical protein